MNHKLLLIGFLVCLALVVAACAAPVAPAPAPTAAPTQPPPTDTPAPAVPTPDVAARIANAMSAAPMAVAKDATLLDFPANAGDPMVVLRKGTNDWTCYADWPASPGNDPECNDPVAEAWLSALFAGKEAPPEITTPGLAYMLAGGSDPSNTDPMAAAPPEGKDWVASPGHVMLIMPGGFDAADYATEPKEDEPFIMWDGTPYEHLMIPVVAAKGDELGDASAELKNTLGAAPVGILRKAKIMGSPMTNAGEMVTLQEGDSGWVCWPDRSVSPGNDPSCNDPVWEALFATAEPQPIKRAGISYMLAGGSDESNTDPMATGPTPGEDWITTPPHLMLLVPGGFDAKLFSTDPASGYPYIMWDGTPYEHLMIPVGEMKK